MSRCRTPANRSSSGDFESLKAEAAFFQWHGLARSTRSAYATAWRHLREFCSSHGIRRLSEEVLLAFAAYLSHRVAPPSVRLYVTGVLSLAKEQGYNMQSRRLELVLSGIDRLSLHRPKQAPAVLPRHLSALHSVLARQIPSQYYRALVWAACCLAFAACLRASEYLSAGVSSFDPARTLLASDVHVASGRLTLKLKMSKTDQRGSGRTITLFSRADVLCPVRALQRYLQFRRGASSLPLFIDQRGQFLTPSRLTQLLRPLFKAAGFGSTEFSLHSFRAGAATSAQLSGLPAGEIMALGRWRSNCYKRYIRA